MRIVRQIAASALFVVLSLSGASAYDLGAFTARYGVTVVFSQRKDTWNRVSYEQLSAQEKERAMDLVSRAFGRYPDDFFRGISLKYLVLGKGVKFDNTARTAVPDNYREQLFLSCDPSYMDYYLAHCIFHEINHYAEFFIWKDYRYRWPRWSELYGGGTSRGGEYAYSNQSADYYSISDGRAGFLNLYSTLGEEEDRSEIVAFFMNDLSGEHERMMQRVKGDQVLQRKVRLLFALYRDRLNFGSLLEDFEREMGGR
ncbi:MAG: hypothetical protein JXA20_09145 [Spirochaetes bacterium]|nr:hypothetical protein [Spirochaetota bacterium]